MIAAVLIALVAANPCGSDCRVARVKTIARKHAIRHNVPPSLVFAVIRTESNWDPLAVSPVGAVGYMQLMPSTAKWLGVNEHDPEDNIRGGVRFLAYLLKRFSDERLAIAAYNAGPGLVHRLGRVPNIPETLAYVEAVLRRKSAFDEM